MFKKISVIFLIIILFLAYGKTVEAGFGISPPYVKTNKPIFPGSHYEQRINLLRSLANEDLQVKATIDAPEIASWISIAQDNTFILPKGKLSVPMIVKVDVPKNAEIGEYTGHINIRIIPKSKSPGGGVAIALGARIDIDLEITNKTFIDFKVRNVTIPNFEVLGWPWKYKIFSWFFYRIKAVISIENTGNTKIAPTKVQIDVYDLNQKKLLQSSVDKSIDKVKPFTTKNVIASFPTDLLPGQYWGLVKIYKNNEIIYKDKIIFAIQPHGKLAGGEKLGIWPWLMLLGLIFIGFIIVAILIWLRIWKYLYKLWFIITWPLRYVWQKIKSIFYDLKIRFWRWIRRKTDKYVQVDNKIKNISKDKKDTRKRKIK